MVKYGVFVAYLVLCVKGWETGLVPLAKLNIDIKHHCIDRILFNQHIFSSYIKHQSYRNMLIGVQSKFYYCNSADL